MSKLRGVVFAADSASSVPCIYRCRKHPTRHTRKFTRHRSEAISDLAHANELFAQRVPSAGMPLTRVFLGCRRAFGAYYPPQTRSESISMLAFLHSPDSG